MEELSDKEYAILCKNITDEIISELKKGRSIHLDDIGNLIGIAIGKHIANRKIWAFEKDDFILGYNHGFSIMDGTHG